MYYSTTSQIFSKKKKDKYIFPIGYYVYSPDGYNNNYWDDFNIDIEGSTRILIIAKTGSGKTFLVRRIMDMMNERNIRNIVINDIKGEMHSSTEPNIDLIKQLKWELPKTAQKFSSEIDFNKLNKLGMEPKGIENMIFYAPEFSYYENHPYYNKVRPYSLKFSNFNEIQARTILEIKDNANNQKRVLNYMLALSYEYAKIGKDILTQEIIYQFRDKIPEYIAAKGSMNTKEKIMVSSEVVSVFDRLVYCIEKDIIDGKYVIDKREFIKELEDNNLIFDWSGLTWQELRDVKSTYSTYLSSIVYILSRAKILDKIKSPICFIADEMQNFLHKDDKNSIKDALQDVYTKGRAYDINAIIAIQGGENLDNVFQHNSNYIFVGALGSTKEIKEFKELFSYVFEDYGPEDRKKANRLLQNLKKHEFLAIDKDNMEFGVIKIYPPLSLHKTKVV